MLASRQHSMTSADLRNLTFLRAASQFASDQVSLEKMKIEWVTGHQLGRSQDLLLLQKNHSQEIPMEVWESPASTFTFSSPQSSAPPAPSSYHDDAVSRTSQECVPPSWPATTPSNPRILLELQPWKQVTKNWDLSWPIWLQISLNFSSLNNAADLHQFTSAAQPQPFQEPTSTTNPAVGPASSADTANTDLSHDTL
jgi:hypothetical protein